MALLRGFESRFGPQPSKRSSALPLPAEIPIPGRVVSICLSLLTLAIISICLSRRVPITRRWRKLPPTSWLLIITYVDSFIFVFISAIVKDLGVNTSTALCQGAILLCLACYLTTKVLIYVFLVEKAYIVRARAKKRFQDKVYLFNFFGLLLPYLIIAILNFIYRIGYINHRGTCIIGMEKKSLVPLITFDVIVNVYLTILFLVPLRKLYSYQNNANSTLRTMAIRTFVGTCCTLISSVVNLTVLTLLEGEPGWICLLACNADVLFSVLVLHWVTVTDKKDLAASSVTASRSRRTENGLDGTRSRHGNDKGAVISTHVETGAEPPLSSRRNSFPADTIKVRTDYVQEVEMDNISQRELSWSDQGKESRSSSSSTEAIV